MEKGFLILIMTFFVFGVLHFVSMRTIKLSESKKTHFRKFFWYFYGIIFMLSGRINLIENKEFHWSFTLRLDSDEQWQVQGSVLSHTNSTTVEGQFEVEGVASGLELMLGQSAAAPTDGESARSTVASLRRGQRAAAHSQGARGALLSPASDGT